MIFWLLSLGVVFPMQAQTSFTLNEAMDYMLDNSTQLKKAQLTVDKAHKRVWETTATGLPQVNGEINYNNYIKQPVSLIPGEIAGGAPGTQIPVVFGTKQNLSAGLTLSQLLFSGSYLVGLESAKAFENISKLSLEKQESVLKENLTRLYIAVLVAKENAEILEKNLKVAEKNLADVKAINQQGLNELQDVEQFNYSYTQLVSAYNIAIRQEEISKNSLKLIMGYPQDEPIMLLNTLDELLENQWLELASEEDFEISEHIDFRLAENDLKTKELLVKYNKSLALPTLSTFISSRYDGFSNDFSFFNRDQDWFNTTLWGVKLQVPLFSGLGRQSVTEQAQIDVYIAQLDQKQLEEDLKEEAKNAFLEYQNAWDNYQTTQELIELSESIYNKEQIKFFEGISTSSALSIAESQFYQAQNQYVQSIFQLSQSIINLNQAIGKYGQP